MVLPINSIASGRREHTSRKAEFQTLVVDRMNQASFRQGEERLCYII
jgi:hypothetical protein